MLASDYMLELVGKSRNDTGTRKSYSLRNSGYIPAVVYGKGLKTQKIAISTDQVEEKARRLSFISRFLSLDIDGKKHLVLPKHVQTHVISDKVLHIDFMVINSDEKHEIEVMLKFNGASKSPAAKLKGNVLVVNRRVKIIIKPEDAPDFIDLDLSNIDFGQTIKAKDLTNYEVLDGERILVTVTGRKTAEETEVAVE